MRRLLVINPNTSAQVSGLLQTHVQAAAGTQVQVHTVTARFGAPYISDEASYAVAAHATLDAWAAALSGTDSAPDAVLIGCFGDQGLLALRDSSAVPVTGLAEASFVIASEKGRFGVVTGGARWAPMLQRLAHALGHAETLAGVHAVAATGAELAANPQAAHRLLAQACRDAARDMGVQAIVLGGAGLAGMAAVIQPQIDVVVIDSVVAGAHWALRNDRQPAARTMPGFDTPWRGVSPEMTALGQPDA